MEKPAEVGYIYDNGGRTFDRYTVTFEDGEAFLAGEAVYSGDTGNVPNGVFMSVEGVLNPEGERIEWDGERIEWDALPEKVQADVRAYVAQCIALVRAL